MSELADKNAEGLSEGGGAEHGAVSINVAYQLKRYLEEHPIGRCFGPGTGFVMSAESSKISMPDIAIVRSERIPSAGLPPGYFPGPPDLAVEIIAPSDKFNDILEKVQDYFEAGTRRVWIVRPRVRMVTVHRSVHDVQILAAAETLTADEVLPGLAIPVAKFFE